MSLCPSRLRVGLHLLFLTLMLLPDTPLCLTVSKKDPGNLGSIIGSFNTTQEADCPKACQAAVTEGCKKGVFRNDTCWLLSCSDPCQEPDIPPLSGGGFQGNNGAGSALTTLKQTHSPLSASSSLLSSGHHDTNLHQSQRNNTVQTLNPDGESTNQSFVHQPLSDSIPPVTPVQEQPSVPPPPTSPPPTPSGKEPVGQSPKDLSPSIPSSKQPVTPKDVLPQLAPNPSLPQVNLSTAALQSPNNTASSVPIEPDSNVSNNASIRLEPENNNNTVINTVQPGQGTTTKANETESVATPTNTPATRKATTPLPATTKTTMSAAVTLPTTAKNTTSTSVTVSTTAKSTTPTAVTTASTTVNTTVTAATTKKPSLTSVATQASMSPIADNKPPVQSPSGSALGNASTSTIANAASSTTTANAVTNQKKHVVNTGGGVAMVEVTAGDLTSHLVDTASLLAVLLIGLLFFVVSVAVLAKQAYESYRRKDYTQVDYLINGMYTDSGV